MNNQDSLLLADSIAQPVYIINPKASSEDLSEALQDRLHKAYALSYIALDPTFISHPEIIIRDYLCQLAETIEEAKDLYNVITQ